MLRHPLYVDRKKEDNSDSVIHIYLFLLFGALMNLLLMIVNSWVKANQANISNSEKIYRITIYDDKAKNEIMFNIISTIYGSNILILILFT